MALKVFTSPLSFTSGGVNSTQSSHPLFLADRHRQRTEVRLSQWRNSSGEKVNQETHHEFKEIETVGTSSNSMIRRQADREYQTRKKFSGNDDHPAFRTMSRTTKEPRKRNRENPGRRADIKMSNDGISYVIDGAPFEFKYSYTETPKEMPLRLREAPFSPFGPAETPRPWTGRAPFPPSKKQLKEFDSFQLPPPNKKGVKPVQSPGPYLPGTGPRYVKTREEILGEPLTAEEIQDLVKGSLRTRRQLNMGRDGLTHNMLDNIHAHWKRKRVCKIKCKGVCTVDMENVCQQLEEKTGGKIIYSKGGVLFLFRGRNYNARTRPFFPLMLWKPVTPVYPRLVKKVPDGLTEEKAAEMRRKGLKLAPICKLGKNGVYSDLVKHVQEAFEVCELVKIDCQGMNSSDYRKIGAKLRDLVPCVIISFEREQILLWRGQGERPLRESVEETPQLFNNPENEDKIVIQPETPQHVELQFDNELNEEGEAEIVEKTEVCVKEEKKLGERAEGIIKLWKEAVEMGSALVMNDENLDADQIYNSSLVLAQTAPSGPVFQHLSHIKTGIKQTKQESASQTEEQQHRTVENDLKAEEIFSKEKKTKQFKHSVRDRLLVLEELDKLLR